jgi:hypothetical protein
MIRREENRGSKIAINKINRADDAGLFSDLGPGIGGLDAR